MRKLVAIAPLFWLPATAAAQPVSGGGVATDTVIRFDVRERTWSWPYFAAHVGLSCHAGNLAIGTTTAPATATQHERYCAGAAIVMRNSTLTLRNARGVVHLRMDRAALMQRQDSTRPRR